LKAEFLPRKNIPSGGQSMRFFSRKRTGRKTTAAALTFNRRKFLQFFTGMSIALALRETFSYFFPRAIAAQTRSPMVIGQGSGKTKIVVLSDIHIGTNAPTVWYQKSFHEPFLSAALNYVIQNAATIQQLVLLGDVVDFWTYPPNTMPKFTDIAQANPNIFGSNGLLSQALTALGGQVFYVNGNHDITLAQSDFNQIQNPQGYKIQVSPGYIYYPLGSNNPAIACTHGHIYTMFNAPYTSSNSNIPPIPLGHFITRSVAYQRSQQLKPGQTVAQLSDSGDPDTWELVSAAISTIATDLLNFSGSKYASGSLSLSKTLLDTMATATGIPRTQPILLPTGQTITFNQAEAIYANLFSEWVAKYGITLAAKSAIADFNGTFIGWFAQKLAFEVGAQLVVMGHTHTPKLGLGPSLVNYVNCGFNCPSQADIGSKHPTFALLDIPTRTASVMQVVQNGSSYSIQPYTASQEIITKGLDYSSYVIIDNTKGAYQLTLTNSAASDGTYVVAPPATIAQGQSVTFWLQDDAGIFGSEGSVQYSYVDSSGKSQQLNLTFGCPTGFSSNYCSGANFYCKSGSGDWGDLNDVSNATYDHPFFVRFVL
jgi:UDP-2,3-diacylglucosamine pyrophosphatase LpxH